MLGAVSVSSALKSSWSSSKTTERIVGVAVLVVVAGYILSQLQVHLLLRDTTPNGGDTGAHVWWPAYMRDHVFPKLRLSGWAPDWYAGFPAGHFYFPIPPLLIVLLDLFIPYNVAFKLVTALGPVLIPVGAYVFARGLRVPWPGPPLFAISMLPFLFFTPDEHNFRIMGGNLPSTLAGEFSFAIALGLALCFLGTLAMALDGRKRPWLPALLLGVTVMTHGIVTVFAAVGGLVVWAVRGPVRGFRVAGAIALVAFLLSAIWTLPVVGRVAYMTDMGWQKVEEYRTYLVHPELRWVIVLAGIALVASAAFLRRATIELAVLAVIFGAMFVAMPEGRLWNLRLLPFYQVPLFMLAAMGVTEVVNLGRRLIELPVKPAATDERGSIGILDGEEQPPEPSRVLVQASMIAGHVAVVFVLVVALTAVDSTTPNGTVGKEFIPSWAKWNNAGYESKTKEPAASEFQGIMNTLNDLRVDYGQRLTWERLDKINNYGSDLALELIPYFTDGKIGSMEGLYFESAGTTPYHFLTVADISSQPSNPVRGLEYGNINDNFDRGVERLRMLGVRFFMAGSDAAKQKACGITDGRTLEQFLVDGDVCTRDDLELVTYLTDTEKEPSVARWALFEVEDVSLVEPLRREPVVLTDVKPHDWRKGHGEGPSVEWFNDPGLWDRFWAGDGPRAWARSEAEQVANLPLGKTLPEVNVTDVSMGDDHVRFTVDRVGVPVLVRVSYFPNWQVRGANGPWRVTPNFMVVVPTEREVELTYGRTPIDRIGIALSVLGVVGLVALARWRPRLDSKSSGEPVAS